MQVYLVLRTFPNEDRLKFVKVDKSEVDKSLPYLGLLTEAQVMHLGGLLLTMGKGDKIVLFRSKADEGFLSLTVQSAMMTGRMDQLEKAAKKGDVILTTIDRQTDFEIADKTCGFGEALFRSREPASEFVLAATHSEVERSRYCIWWHDKITPMPRGTELFARASDVAKLSGNAFKDAGFKFHDLDDRTGTLVMTIGDSGNTEH